MKFVLAALCGIVVLFMGGCAVLAVAAPPLPLLPAGVALLNVLILGALFGWKYQWRPAFYILGVVDLLIAAVAALAASSVGSQDQPFFWMAAGLFALKGVLSFVYARNKTG